jgi:hypothetical protein
MLGTAIRFLRPIKYATRKQMGAREIMMILVVWLRKVRGEGNPTSLTDMMLPASKLPNARAIGLLNMIAS